MHISKCFLSYAWTRMPHPHLFRKYCQMKLEFQFNSPWEKERDQIFIERACFNPPILFHISLLFSPFQETPSSLCLSPCCLSSNGWNGEGIFFFRENELLFLVVLWFQHLSKTCLKIVMTNFVLALFCK